MTDCHKSDSNEPASTPTPDSDRKPVTDYNYSVTNFTSNVTCIAANMSICIEIPYKTTENKVRIESDLFLIGLYIYLNVLNDIYACY